jgi:CRP-like cAMP-binding protein
MPYSFQHIPPFAGLPLAALEHLRTQATPLQRSKGTVLFLQGDSATSLYIVESGWVKLFRETLDGQENLVALCSRGEVFGETGLFGDGSYSLSAETTEDCQLLAIPLSTIRTTIAQDGEFSLRMMARFAERMRQLELKVEHITAMNAPQRIGCFLLSLCAEYDLGKDTASPRFTLPVGKSLIAAQLGMKPETFSRALQQLKNWDVSVDGEHVTIGNLRQLQQQACISCSNTERCIDTGE